MFERILVCLDGSKLAEQILPYAAEEALRFRSQLVLLHVVPEPVVATPGIPGATGVPVETPGMLEQMGKEQKEAAVYLSGIAETLREKGLEAETEILTGAAGSAIVRYSDEKDINLITLATHGRSGLGRTIFGSVADYVLRESGLPVLIIKPQEEEG